MNHAGGMKRHLENARKVLLLDKPTIGLGPQTRRHIWDSLLKPARQQGVEEPRCMAIFLPRNVDGLAITDAHHQALLDPLSNGVHVDHVEKPDPGSLGGPRGCALRGIGYG